MYIMHVPYLIPNKMLNVISQKINFYVYLVRMVTVIRFGGKKEQCALRPVWLPAPSLRLSFDTIKNIIYPPPIATRANILKQVF